MQKENPCAVFGTHRMNDGSSEAGSIYKKGMNAMPVYKVTSPDGRVKLSVFLEDGALSYAVARDGADCASRAPLGLITPDCDLSTGLVPAGETRGAIDEDYSLPAFKKSLCHNRANTLSLDFSKQGHILTVECRAYDDGAAFRLILQGKGDGIIVSEATAFAVPACADTIYAQKLVFSYEDQYHPVPREDLYQNRYAFPLLVHVGGVWALYAEAAVFGDYGGSSVQSTPESPALLRLVKAPDKLSDIQSPLPMHTPWRAVIVGDLNAIATSNLLENLNPPSIVEDTSFIRPGRCAWSWMSENDSSQDPQRMREYVDFAAQMGFEYSVVDWKWPGKVDIAALVEYARPKGVGIWIWEHSATMRDPAVAEEKMRLWSSWGVVGLKIDFFESDDQERIAQYEMLAKLAAKYRLMLNFHGCSKPTGFNRVWPHVMTCEGVMGGEYLQNFSSFVPGGPDAAHHCTLPFTRNAVGPMDFTPVTYDSYLTGTTDVHQTALTVIFTSYILHIGEMAENVLKNPCRPFLEKVPTAWDETRVLEAYPANYVTMARRLNEDWFIAGICARRPRTAKVPLDFLSDGKYEAELYMDDLSDLRPFDVSTGTLPPPDETLCQELRDSYGRPSLHGHNMHAVRTERLTVQSGETLSLPMAVNGGFAMIVRPVK